MSLFSSGIEFDSEDLKNGPIEYQGSHVLPTDTDHRKGLFRLSDIPEFFIEESNNDEKRSPYIRVTVADYGEDDQFIRMILDRDQIKQVYKYLGTWINNTNPL